MLAKANTAAFVSEGYKVCGHCGIRKPVSMFYKRSDRKNGYKSDCIDCILEKREAYRLSKNIRPYYENKECSMYLGIHVAERVLSHCFATIERMPMNNPGYDFVCGKGFKIDVKSACRINRYPGIGWQFNIAQNKMADYFLCLAFDTRKDLAPEHIWLIPGSAINHQKYASIGLNTLRGWSQYERPIDGVLSCCNAMKEEAVT